MIFVLFTVSLLSSCRSYKYNIMFRIDQEEDLSYLSSQINVAEKHYVIQPNDWLEIRVYTNKGEQIIDPNYELDIQQSQTRMTEKPKMLVKEDGSVKFPMLGMVKLGGMQLNEAESYLEQNTVPFMLSLL